MCLICQVFFTSLFVVYVFIADRGALLDSVITLRESGTLDESEYVVLAADVAVDLGEDGCGKYMLPAWTTRRNIKIVSLTVPKHSSTSKMLTVPRLTFTRPTVQ